jgi:hypothetical protein
MKNLDWRYERLYHEIDTEEFRTHIHAIVDKVTLLNELYAMIRRRTEIFINLPFASLDPMALRKRLDEIGDTTCAAPQKTLDPPVSA